MYHCGITSKYVELDLGCEKPIDIVVDTEKIAINPILMTQHLKNHFLEYERKLREPENSKLRENFESRFDTFSSSKNDQDEFFTKFFLSQE